MLAVTLLGGCIFVDVDEPPRIDWAEATCGYDAGYRDWVWTFEAHAWDEDGDLAFVDADVYDEYSGAWLDSFPLESEPGRTWFSAWLERTTRLYCGDPYIIDFVAEDGLGNGAIYTVYLGEGYTR